MSQLCILFLVMFKFVSVYGYPGETIMMFPPFEVRTVDRHPLTSTIQANRDLHGQQPILHTNRMPPRLTTEKHNSDMYSDHLNEAGLSHEESLPQFRTSTYERDNNESSYRPYPGPYLPPSLPPYASNPPYRNSSPVTVLPSSPVLPKLPSLKPDLSTLFKPTATKVSSKTSGLLSLILALFSGSSTGGLQMNGLKDLVINGIVKPLLVAKGGIKSLIGKLAIPVIALILINIEVLITVWWLWEDCEPKKPPVPSYPYPKPSYNYNNYNSYR